jgi:peptide/nickel transport system substrate-binding protein
MDFSRAKTRRLKLASAAAVAAASAAATFAAFALPASSSANTAHSAAVPPLIMESSPENAITQDFNPFVQSTGPYQMGVDSLIYEPLMDFNLAKPSAPPYYMLATAYKWGTGGTSITFTIRSGVNFTNGTPMTAADVAATFLLLMKYPDINNAGLPITGATASGSTVTVTFSSAQYTNLQAIGNVYVVPTSIWSTVGDPAMYTDANPVGTGPYEYSSFSTSGITLKPNPGYWGGTPALSGGVEFPVFASNTTVLSALTQNQLDWAGNFLSGLQSAFVSPSPSTHHTWFAPVQTNSLEPNLQVWPTNQLAVRKAISLAINRTAIDTQGEAGLEPVAQNASGIVLPGFSGLLVPAVKKYTLSSKPDPAAAIKVMKAAGFVIKHGFFYKGNKEVTIPVTDPSAYTDYAADDAIIAQNLKKAHINASFVGQSATAWAADLAKGNFVLSQHWSQTTISAYQLYDYWLNSTLINGAAGNFERLKNKAINNDLAKLSGQTTTAGELKDLTPIEKYVATQVPIIPTVYGAAFDEYNSSSFTGWPSASDQYEIGQPGSPQNEIVVLHLKPAS